MKCREIHNRLTWPLARPLDNEQESIWLQIDSYSRWDELQSFLLELHRVYLHALLETEIEP